jgi:hypothetical protein
VAYAAGPCSQQLSPLPAFTTQDAPPQQLQQGSSGVVHLMQVPAMPQVHSQHFFAQPSPQMQQQQLPANQIGASGPSSGLLLSGQMVAQQGLLHCSPQQHQQQPVSVGVLTSMLQGTALQL